MIKYRKIFFLIFSFACVTAMGICYIVDSIINLQITWSAYPLLSIPFVWLVISPIFIKKYGVLLSPSSLTLFTIPFIYYLEKITPVGGWFYTMGLPFAVSGIVTGWAFYLLFRFAKMSPWYKASISVFFAGVIISPLTNYYVCIVLNSEPAFLNLFINVFSSFVISALLGILGYSRKKIRSAE